MSQTTITQPKPSPKKSILSRLFKYALIGIGLLILLFFLFYFAVLLGLFGRLPSTSELQAIRNPVASEIYSADNVLLGKFYMEDRSNVEYENISQDIINALVATEDSRFFEHGGVDTRSLLRVLVKSVLMGDGSSGGGSTISQQLVKNLYKRERNYGKLSIVVTKMKEALIARRLERTYTKEDILALYLNTVPFGERAFGIETACERFFSVTPDSISLENAATLVGMLKAPTYYSPRLNPEHSTKRRNLVLQLMSKNGYISQGLADATKKKPLILKYNRVKEYDGIATYFRKELKNELKEWCANNTNANGDPYNLFTDGLKIYTTIDSKMQEMAEGAVAGHMSVLQEIFEQHLNGGSPWGGAKDVLDIAIKSSNRYKRLKESGASLEKIRSSFQKPIPMKLFAWNEEGSKEMTISPADSIKYMWGMLNAGFLAADPYTGHIKAWVGGIELRNFPEDRVVSKRQVGSTFKPFVYGTAISKGISPCKYYPNELYEYEKFDNWSPRNADNKYGGYYSMQGGLVNSVNTIAVQTILDAKVDNVVSLAKDLGIQNEIPQVPSIALGTAELTLEEMVGAYCSFANGGYQTPLLKWITIQDHNGKVIAKQEYQSYQKRKSALKADVSEMMVHMMEQVVNDGTARSLRSNYRLSGVPMAGKTGTTQNQTDGWFIGFTPSLVAGCWVGGSDRRVHFRSLSLGQGARTALPIWGLFMEDVYNAPAFEGIGSKQFLASNDIENNMNCSHFSYSGKNRSDDRYNDNPDKDGFGDVVLDAISEKLNKARQRAEEAKAKAKRLKEEDKKRKEEKKRIKALKKKKPAKEVIRDIFKGNPNNTKAAEEDRNKRKLERERKEQEQRRKETERKRVEEEKKRTEELEKRRKKEERKRVEDEKKRKREVENQQKQREKERKKEEKRLEKERKKEEKRRKREEKRRGR